MVVIQNAGDSLAVILVLVERRKDHDAGADSRIQEQEVLADADDIAFSPTFLTMRLHFFFLLVSLYSVPVLSQVLVTQFRLRL